MEALEQIRVRVLPDGRLSRNDAAAYLGRKPKTLAMWALEKRGPKVIRVGGRCFYNIDNLRAYVERGAAG